MGIIHDYSITQTPLARSLMFEDCEIIYVTEFESSSESVSSGSRFESSSSNNGCDTESRSTSRSTNGDPFISPRFSRDDNDEEHVLFFNYNNDGSSYAPTCMSSPIRKQHEENGDDGDEDDGLTASLSHLRIETDHINCPCISRDCYGTYPRLRINGEEKYDGKTTGNNEEAKIARLLDNAHLELLEEDLHPDFEYVAVACKNEEPSVNVTLYIEKPQLPSAVIDIRTHLLHCVLRSFFTCSDNCMAVEWINSIQYKISQLLKRGGIQPKFANRHNFDTKTRACLLLTHDASILLRDFKSSVLTNIADVLQISRRNLVVLEKSARESPVYRTL